MSVEQQHQQSVRDTVSSYMGEENVVQAELFVNQAREKTSHLTRFLVDSGNRVATYVVETGQKAATGTVERIKAVDQQQVYRELKRRPQGWQKGMLNFTEDSLSYVDKKTTDYPDVVAGLGKGVVGFVGYGLVLGTALIIYLPLLTVRKCMEKCGKRSFSDEEESVVENE